MRGFTIVELVVVILLIGVLAVAAIPRFLDSTDEARLAAAQATTASFEESISMLHGQWLVAGKPATVTVNETIIEFDANGWPTSSTPGVPGCVEIWDAVYHNSEPVVPFVALAAPEAWSALRFGAICLYVYQYGKAFTATDPLPFFIYQPLPTGFNILRFNMT